MNMTLIIVIVASICVGGAAGAGLTRIFVEKPVCHAEDATWQKFINVAPQNDPGTTYK